MESIEKHRKASKSIEKHRKASNAHFAKIKCRIFAAQTGCSVSDEVARDTPKEIRKAPKGIMLAFAEAELLVDLDFLLERQDAAVCRGTCSGHLLGDDIVVTAVVGCATCQRGLLVGVVIALVIA